MTGLLKRALCALSLCLGLVAGPAAAAVVVTPLPTPGNMTSATYRINGYDALDYAQLDYTFYYSYNAPAPGAPGWETLNSSDVWLNPRCEAAGCTDSAEAFGRALVLALGRDAATGDFILRVDNRIPITPDRCFEGLSAPTPCSFTPLSPMYLEVKGTAADWSLVNFTYEESAVPEPSAWILMIAGFGLVGTALRCRQRLRFSRAGSPPCAVMLTLTARSMA